MAGGGRPPRERYRGGGCGAAVLAGAGTGARGPGPCRRGEGEARPRPGGPFPGPRCPFVSPRGEAAGCLRPLGASGLERKADLLGVRQIGPGREGGGACAPPPPPPGHRGRLSGRKEASPYFPHGKRAAPAAGLPAGLGLVAARQLFRRPPRPERTSSLRGCHRWVSRTRRPAGGEGTCGARAGCRAPRPSSPGRPVPAGSGEGRIPAGVDGSSAPRAGPGSSRGTSRLGEGGKVRAGGQQVLYSFSY